MTNATKIESLKKRADYVKEVEYAGQTEMHLDLHSIINRELAEKGYSAWTKEVNGRCFKYLYIKK